MKRYRLYMKRGDKLEDDTEGQEFPSLEAARSEALRSARELWDDAIPEGRDLSHYTFIVVDDDGHHCALVPFDDVAPKR
jgi:hypothetical protein